MGEGSKDVGVRVMHEYAGGMKNASAISEVISVVLLLGVVVVGVGLIAVTIYSQPTPEKTPQVDILVSKNDSTISLTHNGGDSLAEGSFYVLAEGTPLYSPVSPPGGAWPWTIGEVLQYKVSSVPGRVQVAYTGGGGEVLLKSATFTGASEALEPDVPAGPWGGGEWVESELNISFGSSEERDEWVVEQFVKQLEGNSIYLSQATWGGGSNAWACSGSFEFTLNDSSTYLEIDNKNNPTKVTFAKNDVLKIELVDKDNPAMRFFAIGHGGWHISAANVKVYKNGTQQGDDKEKINRGKIYDYSNFDSSVVIKTPSISVQTELYVNNTPIDTWNKEITLTNIRPADPTLMILDISKGDPCYFVGSAEWEIVET
ncbi:MAG: type IV pilin [Methanomicrobiaceae archaeon]|nr:type IV pilin [Methanomicrobiaceae archaeon]